MTHDDDRDPVVEALRASLAQHARQAPDGDRLTQRIVHAAGRRPGTPDRRARRWRAWALPLVAAGAVGAVVAAVIGIESYRPDSASPPPVAASRSAVPVVPASPARSTNPSEFSTPALSAGPSVGDRATVSTVLRDVRVQDLTFAGADDGWALASAGCVKGVGRCTALLRTTDGDRWHSVPGAAFNVPGVRSCADPCVTDLRFADDRVGYAYGPDALFMTTDGGATWTRQPGGAVALETFDGDVIRVLAHGGGCPGPCATDVATAPIGGSQWRTQPFPDRMVRGYGVGLARAGSAAYLLATGPTAGGAGRAWSTLYRSTDDGRSWQARAEPCPQTDGEVDSISITAGDGGRVSVLCASRQAPQRAFVATSVDFGATFAARAGRVPPAATGQLTGDPHTVLVSGGSGLARSTDGGRSWQRADGPTGTVTFLGFESPRVGRAVDDGGRSIWTTRDAGATWSQTTLG